MLKKLTHRIIFKLKNATISVGKGAIVNRNMLAGNNCKIGRYSKLSKTVILGNQVQIGEHTTLSNISIGNRSVIEGGVKIVGTNEGQIRLGNHCYIGLNNVLDTSDDILIGDFVHIAGPSTALWCHSSAKMCQNSIPINDKNRKKFRPTAPITIENNVYIGGNCTIYPGVTIGKYSIISPNSAVANDVPPYTMVGGVPASKIKDVKNIKA